MSTFQQEDLDRIEDIRQKYTTLGLHLIEIVSEKSALKLKLEEVEKRYERVEEVLMDMRKQEQALAKRLSDKYGEGCLNTETGEFFSAKQH